jgi:hypothetical protein
VEQGLETVLKIFVTKEILISQFVEINNLKIDVYENTEFSPDLWRMVKLFKFI